MSAKRRPYCLGTHVLRRPRTVSNLSRRYQVVADNNFKYVLKIKDVPKFKDART